MYSMDEPGCIMEMSTRLIKFEDLQDAITSGDTVVARHLVQDLGVNMRDEMGATAMHFAAKAGSVKMLNLFVEMGAFPDVVDGLGFTPYLISARYGHLECLKRLVELGVDIERRTFLGLSAQCLADLAGHTHVVSRLHDGSAESVQDLKATRHKFSGQDEGQLIFAKPALPPPKPKRRSILGVLTGIRARH